MIDVRERLRAIRTHLGETQKSMSTRFGLGEATWQSYELGGRLPKPEALSKLVALGFDANWILTGQGSMLRQGRAQAAGAETAATWLDEGLLGRVIQGLEESMAKFTLELSPEKKAHALVTLYRHFAADLTVGRELTPERISAVVRNLPRIDRLTCVRQVIESLGAKKLLERYLQHRFGKSRLDRLSDDELRETAIWALSLQDTLPAQEASSPTVVALQDRGRS